MNLIVRQLADMAFPSRICVHHADLALTVAMRAKDPGPVDRAGFN
jgi:hypothetical protein